MFANVVAAATDGVVCGLGAAIEWEAKGFSGKRGEERVSVFHARRFQAASEVQ